MKICLKILWNKKNLSFSKIEEKYEHLVFIIFLRAVSFQRINFTVEKFTL